jgi:ABC-type polysaccharide/polyol phosphate export permease
MTSILMPLWMCSGLLWPIESVPDTLRMLFYFNPLTLPIESLRSVMLRGWGINNPNIIIGYISSIAYSSIVFIINIIIFNKFSSSTIF